MNGALEDLCPYRRCKAVGALASFCVGVVGSRTRGTVVVRRVRAPEGDCLARRCEALDAFVSLRAGVVDCHARDAVFFRGSSDPWLRFPDVTGLFGDAIPRDMAARGAPEAAPFSEVAPVSALPRHHWSIDADASGGGGFSCIIA